MTSPVSNLQASVATGDERYLLQWSNPGTLDTIIVQVAQPSGSGNWVTQYQGNPITQLYVYPMPLQSADMQVIAQASGVQSAPDTITGYTLPVWCSEWAIFLTDTVSPATLHANLGLFLNYSGMQYQYLSRVKSYIPSGSAFPKDFPSRARYRQFSNTLAFEVPPSCVLSDGSVASNFPTIQSLRSMAPNRLVPMLWRDISPTFGQSMYVKMLDYKEQPTADNGWHIEMVLEERQPPVYPLTSST